MYVAAAAIIYLTYSSIADTRFTKSSTAVGFLIKHFASSSAGNDSLNSLR